MTALRCPDHPAHLLTRDGFCLAITGGHRPDGALDHYPEMRSETMTDQILTVDPESEIPGTIEGIAEGNGDGPLAEVDVTALADPETGELPPKRQLTLSNDLFPPVKRREVPTVKVAFSGAVELTREAFEALIGDRQIRPGSVVEVKLAGYAPAAHGKWVKRTEGRDEDKEVWWELQGAVPIRVTDLGEIEVTGEEWCHVD